MYVDDNKFLYIYIHCNVKIHNYTILYRQYIVYTELCSYNIFLYSNANIVVLIYMNNILICIILKVCTH